MNGNLKNILIVGGLGYLGGRIVKYLCDQKYQVKVTTRKQPSEYPENVPVNCNIYTTNYDSTQELCELLSDVDCIIHLAGPDAHTHFINAESLINAHVVLTEKLLHASRQCLVSKFIYLSTIHVYGSNLKGIINEETKPLPEEPFSKAHYEAENIILSNKDNISKVILRCANTFGAPYFDNEKCWKLVVNNFYKNAIETGVITVKSPHTHRTFYPVSLLCKQIEGLIINDNFDGVFNVGEKESISMMEMAQRLKLTVNKNSNGKCKIDIINSNATDIEKPFVLKSKLKNISAIDLNQTYQIDITEFDNN